MLGCWGVCLFVLSCAHKFCGVIDRTKCSFFSFAMFGALIQTRYAWYASSIWVYRWPHPVFQHLWYIPDFTFAKKVFNNSGHCENRVYLSRSGRQDLGDDLDQVGRQWNSNVPSTVWLDSGLVVTRLIKRVLPTPQHLIRGSCMHGRASMPRKTTLVGCEIACHYATSREVVGFDMSRLVGAIIHLRANESEKDRPHFYPRPRIFILRIQ